MGMTLSAAKPLMEQNLKKDLNNIIKSSFEKALEAALKKQNEELNRVSKPSDDTGSDAKKAAERALEEACKEFGKVASQEMAGDIAKLISSEVHDFVKEMMITVNNAPVLPTVVSPMGPCTGTLTIMPTFFQIS